MQLRLVKVTSNGGLHFTHAPPDLKSVTVRLFTAQNLYIIVLMRLHQQLVCNRIIQKSGLFQAVLAGTLTKNDASVFSKGYIGWA